MSGAPPAGRHLNLVPPLADTHRAWDLGRVDEPAEPDPTGKVVVLRLDGELDAAAVPVVAAAIDVALDRRIAHLIVDLGDLVFSSVRGIALLNAAAHTAAERGIGYRVSSLPPQVRAVWELLWPPDQRPPDFPDADSAVLDALGGHQPDPVELSVIRENGTDTGRHTRTRSRTDRRCSIRVVHADDLA